MTWKRSHFVLTHNGECYRVCVLVDAVSSISRGTKGQETETKNTSPMIGFQKQQTTLTVCLKMLRNANSIKMKL